MNDYIAVPEGQILEPQNLSLFIYGTLFNAKQSKWQNIFYHNYISTFLLMLRGVTTCYEDGVFMHSLQILLYISH